MAERRDADVLEIVVCQLAEQLAVDVVGAENLGILSETDPAEPIVDVQVQPPPGLLSAALFEKLESLAPTVIPTGFLNQLGFAMWTPTTRQKYSRTVSGMEGFEFFRFAISALVTNDAVPGRSRLYEQFQKEQGGVLDATPAPPEGLASAFEGSPGIGTPGDFCAHIKHFQDAGVESDHPAATGREESARAHL